MKAWRTARTYIRPLQQQQQQQQQQGQRLLSKQLPIRRNFSQNRIFDRIKPCWSQPSAQSLRQYGFTRQLLQRLRQTRFQSNSKNTPPKPDITGSLGSPSSSLSFSQRMRKLSREYGWVAFGVYMGLSALDFPFCFLAVRALGTERIGHWEHVIVQGFWKVVTYPFPQLAKYGPQAAEGAQGADQKGSDGAVGEAAAEWSWGVEEAQEKHDTDATIWTQLALAYAIHKSFIFIRVPLTVAVLPKVVKTLRAWGWNIGKRASKTAS